MEDEDNGKATSAQPEGSEEDNGKATGAQMEDNVLWLRGLPLNLNTLVVNQNGGLECELSKMRHAIDSMKRDMNGFTNNFSTRLTQVQSVQDAMGFSLGEVLVACESSLPCEPVPADSSEEVASTLKSDGMLYGKAAVVHCVQQRKDEMQIIREEMAWMRDLVNRAYEHAAEASNVVPRVDHFELVARDASENYRRLMEEHSAFSGFFGNEGAFTAGTLRQELENHRKSVEGLESQISQLDSAIKLQCGDLDLSRKIEELQRLEAAFQATAQEQKAWTARRLQEMTLKLDSMPAVAKQKSEGELEKSNGNRIEVKLRGELKTLQAKVDCFEHLLAEIALPHKELAAAQMPSRSPSPPKELPSTTWQGDMTEPSNASFLDLKAPQIDECTGVNYISHAGNLDMDTGAENVMNTGAENDIPESSSIGSPPLQKVPSMDVRVRVQSKRTSEMLAQPRWFHEHRSAVLSSREMRTAVGPQRLRPQSARPFSH